MKKSVKILSAILTLVTLLPTTVFAADKTVNNQVMCGDGDTGIPLSYEEQLVQIEEDETLTPEQKEIQKEKLTFGEQINQIERNSGLSRAEKDSKLYRLSGDLAEPMATSISLYVFYFKQETSYYCGPATARQTIATILNSVVRVPTQSAIANDPAFGGVSASGGTLNATKMRQYINSKASANYIEVVNYTSGAMQLCLDRGLTDGNPPILRMKNTKAPSSTLGVSWRYRTPGHYLNVSGKINATTYQVTDPYIEYANPSITNGKFNVTLSQIYDVVQQHSSKSFWF